MEGCTAAYKLIGNMKMKEKCIDLVFVVFHVDEFTNYPVRVSSLSPDLVFIGLITPKEKKKKKNPDSGLC